MTQKTYKREIACALLAYWAILNTLGVWFPDAAVAAEAAKIPAFTFAAGAFALQSASTQFNR